MAEDALVYVACSAGDTDRAGRLCAALEERGLHVFLHAWDVLPGQVTVDRVDEAIQRCGAAVIVVSGATGRIREYPALTERADLGGLVLVPVVFDGAAVPPSLSGRERVDFAGAATSADHERRYDALAGALRGEPIARRGFAAPEFDRTAETPMVVRLRVAASETVLEPPAGSPVIATHGGVTAGLRDLVAEVGRDRFRPSRAERAIADLGRELGERFLPEPVAPALAALLAEARTRNQAVRIRLETELAELPWETLVLPGEDTPLALRPQVRLYRGRDLGPTPQPDIPGPLRILAVIASPDDGGQDELDYEHELSTILRRVDSARRGGAHVRVLNWGSVAAIREALHEERFHILHISCHAAPGVLLMETPDGGVDEVDAVRLAGELVLPGRGVPLIVLAGCHTAQTEAGPGVRQTTEALPGLAHTLLEHGVPAVIAMTTAVTDIYATELLSKMYGRLSRAGEPADALGALADARREVEAARAARPARDRMRQLPEWPTATMFARTGDAVLYDPRTRGAMPRPVGPPGVAEGIAYLDDGEFVGRRADLRLLLRVLRGRAKQHGVLIHGVGGIGKSSLAVQAARMAASAGGTVVASLHGRCTSDEIMTAVAARLRVAGLPDTDDDRRLQRRLTDPQDGWQLRLEILRDEVLERGVDVLILIDDPLGDPAQAGLEVTLDADVRDFLSAWLRIGRGARLLVTSRQAGAVAHPQLLEHHLGPLSRAELDKLTWRLPAVYALDEEQLARAYRDLGGHPRSLEYLEAILSSGPDAPGGPSGARGGSRPFDRVAERMEAGLRRRGVRDVLQWMRSAAGDIDVATAEAVAEISADVLLDGILERLAAGFPEARELLLAASVHRLPVTSQALQWVVTEPPAVDPERVARLRAHYDRLRQSLRDDPDTTLEDLPMPAEDYAQLNRDLAAQTLPADVPWLAAACTELARLGLLTPITDADGDRRWLVHRWTASALAVMAPAEVRRAHLRAASYRRWWAALNEPDPEYDHHADLAEAHHHCIAAGDVHQAIGVAVELCVGLYARSALRQERQVCQDTIALGDAGRSVAWFFRHQLGVIALRLGDYSEAERHLEHCRTLAETQREPVAEATSMRELGALAQLGGRPETAHDLYLRAAQRCQEPAVNGTPAALTVLASCYQQLGALTLARGDRAAWRWSLGALRIAEELEDTNGLAAADRDLARLARAIGDTQRADEHELSAGENVAVDQDSLRLFATSALQCGAVQLMRGAPGMAMDHLLQALQAALDLQDLPLLAQCLQLCGDVLFEVGDHDSATAMYRELATAAEELEDPVRQAIAEQQLGRVIGELGEHALAERHFTEADAIAARLHSTPLLAANSLFRGSVAEHAGDVDGARELLLRAMTTADGADDAVWVASAIQHGSIDASGGAPEEAARWFDLALRRAAATGNQRSMVACLIASGLLARQDDRDGDAVGALRRAVRVAEQDADHRAAAGGLLHLGRIEADRGDLRRAEVYYGRILRSVDAAQDADLVAEARRQRGRCRLEHEKYAEAIEDFEAAASFYRAHESAGPLAWCLLHIYRGCLMTGDDEAAAEAGSAAGGLAERLPDTPLRVVALIASGEHRLYVGEPEPASAAFDAARAAAARIEDPPAGLVADARRMLARVCRTAGDHAGAAAHLGGAVAIADVQQDRLAVMHDSRDLGRACRDLGREDEAREHLERSATIAERLHNQAAADACAALLAADRADRRARATITVADGQWRDTLWLRRTRHIVGERPFADGTPRYLGPSVDQVLREMSPRWSAVAGVPLVCRPFRLTGPRRAA